MGVTVILVHADEVPMGAVGVGGGRPGTWETRTIFNEEIGIETFNLMIYYTDGSFTSPRHHHNFDQYRYQIAGLGGFAGDGDMTPGMLGYFPEGAYYGPQTETGQTVWVLQFGGPSGAGKMTGSEARAAQAQMRIEGVIEGGIFKRNEGVEGRRNQDSAEAVWEYAKKRKLIYPKPQYERPVMMDTNNCPWIPTDRIGVSERALGTFTSAKMKAATFKLEPGSSFTLGGRAVIMIISGEGEVDGQGYREQTHLYLADDEQVTFSADKITEILYTGLPSHDYLTAAAHAAGFDASEEDLADSAV